MATMKKPPSISTTTTTTTDADNIAYGMPTPTNHNTEIRLAQIDELKLFLATATQQWEPNKSLKRFGLPAGESVSCVLWNDLFFITGTDIVRSLTFRFYAFGRPVTNAKKFEEGIFSDLRNLKPGNDARLEEPKSELLDMLYKNNCIRTQKKQKVFFWFSVPHDRLFLDALERDLKREKMGMEPTTQAIAEPASSLSLDSTQELFDQLRKTMSQSAAATAQAIEEEVISVSVPNNSQEHWSSTSTSSPTSSTNNHVPWSASQSRLERAASQAMKRSRVNSVPASIGQQQQFQLKQQNRLSHGSYFSNKKYNRHSTSSLHSHHNQEDIYDDYMDPISNGVDQLDITCSLSTHSTTSSHHSTTILPSKSLDSNAMKKTKTIFGNLSLFDGSPTYKQRRRRAASVSTTSLLNNGVRRHDKCHLRNSTPTDVPILNNNNSSRLAMAAVKAGFAPNQIITSNSTTMLPTHHWNSTTSASPPMIDYLCPMNNCGRLFKRSDHLERHMNQYHTFICHLCGKPFNRSEILAQHHRLEHHHDTSSTVHMMYHSDNNNNDDDSSPPDQRQHFHQYNNATTRVLNHQYNTNSNSNDFNYSSPRHSFDSSRSSGWSTTNNNNNVMSHSNSSSRCSTLSPMLDIDFDMPDIQQPQQQQQQQASQSTESFKKMIEDDFSSSSASSPSSTLQYNNNNNNNMTLLASFKPIQQQQQQQQQQQYQQQDILSNIMPTNEYHHHQQSFHHLEDVSMFLNNNSYAPFNQQQQQYTPFITSPDMSIVFGA